MQIIVSITVKVFMMIKYFGGIQHSDLNISAGQTFSQNRPLLGMRHFTLGVLIKWPHPYMMID